MFKYILSIVIPTDRYSQHLVRLLKYLKNICGYRDIEIVIISTSDNPANTLYEKVCKSIPNCFFYAIERKERRDTRTKQMNLGATLIHGVYMYRIDDDMLPTCKFIKELLSVLKHQDVDAILHGMVPRPISLWAKVRMIEKMYSSFNLYQNSCRIIRKDIFIKLGGYKEDLVVGEDIEFQNRLLRLKPKIIVIPMSKGFEIHLGESQSLAFYIRRAWYYGKFIQNTLRKMGSVRVFRSYSIPLMPNKVVTTFRIYTFPYILYKIVLTMVVTMSYIFNHSHRLED